MDRILRCGLAPARGPARAAQRPAWWQSICTLYICISALHLPKISTIHEQYLHIYAPAHRAAVPAVVHEEPRVHRRGVTQPGLGTGISSGGIIIINNHYLSILHPPKLYTAHLARLVGQVHRQPVPNRASPPPPSAMWPRVRRRVWTK